MGANFERLVIDWGYFGKNPWACEPIDKQKNWRGQAPGGSGRARAGTGGWGGSGGANLGMYREGKKLRHTHLQTIF